MTGNSSAHRMVNSIYGDHVDKHYFFLSILVKFKNFEEIKKTHVFGPVALSVHHLNI
jgi:hypothetical protein